LTLRKQRLLKYGSLNILEIATDKMMVAVQNLNDYFNDNFNEIFMVKTITKPPHFRNRPYLENN